jgi:hypothetical protein
VKIELKIGLIWIAIVKMHNTKNDLKLDVEALRACLMS